MMRVHRSPLRPFAVRRVTAGSSDAATAAPFAGRKAINQGGVPWVH
jgi:hypothetical protein